MVDLKIKDDDLVVTMRGVGRLLALRHRVSVPVSAITGVRHDPHAVRGLWKGWRIPGTHVPGVLVAGTYYAGGRKAFWFASRAGRALVIDLEGHEFDRIVVEVPDPGAAITMLTRALAEA